MCQVEFGSDTGYDVTNEAYVSAPLSLQTLNQYKSGLANNLPSNSGLLENVFWLFDAS